MKLFHASIAFLSLCAGVGAADLGDPAANLKIAKWVKGEPVQVSDDKNVYVVEFWATWCPPCRESIPHLTELQKQFKEKSVVFVGISDENESVVAPFVKKQGDKMAYRVAIDDDRGTSKGYMEAYGIGGIPHAFVVQKNQVIWQGHPMAGLDKALDEITSGKYDLAKAKAQHRVETLYKEFREAVVSGADEVADKYAEELRQAAKGTDFPIAKFDPEKEKREIHSGFFRQQYRGAIFAGDTKRAEEAGQQLKKLDPQINLEKLRDEVETQKLVNMYFESIAGEETKGPEKEAGEKLAEKLRGQDHLANEVAWQMLTNPRVKHRDTALALKIAKQACEDSHWEKAYILDTYARALFDSGDKEEAIKFQQKAVAAAGKDSGNYERTLTAYKAGKLPQESE